MRRDLNSLRFQRQLLALKILITFFSEKSSVASLNLWSRSNGPHSVLIENDVASHISQSEDDVAPVSV